MAEPVVIARGFEGEPHRLIVIGSNASRVLVAKPEALKKIHEGESDPISLPRSDVFEFNEGVYLKLQQEWNSLGQTASGYWRQLQPWLGR